MRLKKGFTLAEILIVLMVIGVIATMTIPSMMKGVTESQFKTGYKKAYNTIANFAAMERVAGQWASIRDNAGVNLGLLYRGMDSALSVTSYVSATAGSGVIVGPDSFDSCAQIIVASKTEGEKTTTTTAFIGTANTGKNDKDEAITTCDTKQPTETPAAKTDAKSIGTDSLWLVTEDNIAYTVLAGLHAAEEQCGTKQKIGNTKSHADALAVACYAMVVDVNGLSKGPNTFESQGLASAMDTASASATITSDQYYIYLGTDGVSSGPRAQTITGRIMADLK